VHLHVALLADAVGAVGGLRLDRRLPQQIEAHDVIGRHQVFVDPGGFQRRREDLARTPLGVADGVSAPGA
jgi:hypothetical protein